MLWIVQVLFTPALVCIIDRVLRKYPKSSPQVNQYFSVDQNNSEIVIHVKLQRENFSICQNKLEIAAAKYMQTPNLTQCFESGQLRWNLFTYLLQPTMQT